MQKQQFKNFDEDELNLYDYFTSSCFKGFSNDNQVNKKILNLI